MFNIKAAIAQLLSEFGFDVATKDGELQLFFGLYTQGSGVCFSGQLGSFKPLLDRMRIEGHLAEALRAKDLIDNHGLKFRVCQMDHRYTHAQTMHIETEGPTSDLDDAEEVTALVELLSTYLTELKDQASDTAFWLLRSFFDLVEHDLDSTKSYTTNHFKVELRKKSPKDGDKLLEDHLGDLSPSEALDEMRAATRVLGEYSSYHFKVSVSYRANPNNDNWQEVVMREIDEGCFTAGYVKRVVKSAIQEARTNTHQYSTHEESV